MTMFNGDPVMKLRLEWLYNHVDRFYITEQRYTYQGARKEQLYIEKFREWFTGYTDKIVFLVDETDYSKETNPWVIESAMRNLPVPRILEDYAGQEYICSVCDCDEIPDWRAVQKESEKLYDACSVGAVSMLQQLFYYNLNWSLGLWEHPFFVNDKTVQKLKDFQIIRASYDHRFPHKFPCGWHFSYFMETDDIIRKIESFSHTEVNEEPYKQKDHVKECITTGKPLFGEQGNIQRNTSLDYPKEIIVFHCNLMAKQYSAF